ncbi:unnamed protein product [Closterium sp. NIES-54]
MATLAAVSGSTLLPVKSLSTVSRCSVSACSNSNARAPAGNVQQKPLVQSPSLIASASLAAAAAGALSLSLLGLASPQSAAAATADVIAASAAVPADVSSILDLADFQAGFASAFLLVLFSEIGDKTFFIAAVLATRRPNLEVFAGTFGALAVMTVLSVALGRIFHYADELLPAFGSFDFPLDDVASVVLLKPLDSFDFPLDHGTFMVFLEASEAVLIPSPLPPSLSSQATDFQKNKGIFQTTMPIDAATRPPFPPPPLSFLPPPSLSQLFFGLSTLRDAAGMDSKAEEEQQEVRSGAHGVLTTLLHRTSLLFPAALHLLPHHQERRLFHSQPSAQQHQQQKPQRGSIFSTVLSTLRIRGEGSGRAEHCRGHRGRHLPGSVLGMLLNRTPLFSTARIPPSHQAEKAVAGLNAAEGTEGGISLAVLASVFALVFTAEWGDKSFFSTIGETPLLRLLYWIHIGMCGWVVGGRGRVGGGGITHNGVSGSAGFSVCSGVHSRVGRQILLLHHR